MEALRSGSTARCCAQAIGTYTERDHGALQRYCGVWPHGRGLGDPVRINHLELSVAGGFLTDDYCARLHRLFGTALGWAGDGPNEAGPPGGPNVRRMCWRLPNGQSLVVFEDDSGPTRNRGDEHFGLEMAPDELRAFLAACQRLAYEDPALEFKHVETGGPSRIPMGDSIYLTFFVRYLLPTWVQVEAWEPVRSEK
jgi:hypothetical protein